VRRMFYVLMDLDVAMLLTNAHMVGSNGELILLNFT